LIDTRILLAISRFVLVSWLGTWALAVLTLAVGGHVQAWHVVVGTLLGLAAIPDRRWTRTRGIVLVAGCAGFAVCCTLIAVVIPDLSWDANLYHYPAMFALRDGWNPLLDRHSQVTSALTSPGLDLVVRCYPKAAWIYGASAHELVANIDVAQSLGWLLLPAPLGPSFLFFRVMLRQGKWTAFIASLLVAVNPVVTYQLATGYIDGLMGSLLPTTLFAALISVKTPMRGALAISTVGTALMIGTKFTGLVYAGVIWSVAILGMVIVRQLIPQRAVTAATVGALLGVLLAADSYVANAVEHGNVFYSAWRPGHSNIDAHMSDEFLQLTRVEKLVRSLGSRPIRSDVAATIVPTPRVPFTDLHWTYTYEPRFSGFGPVFWEALLLSCLLLLCRRRLLGTFAMIAVVGSALATEAAWWARLAPQVWLIPLLLITADRTNRRGARALPIGVTWTVLLLLSIDSTIVATKCLREPWKSSQWFYAHVLSGEGDRDGMLGIECLRPSLIRRIHEMRANNGIRERESRSSKRPALTVADRLRIGFGLRLREDQ
jgi:hypothetical protein